MKASQLPVRMSLLEMFLSRQAQHWGGLAFAFGNVLFLVNKLNEMSRLFLGRPMPDVISGEYPLENPGLIFLGQVPLIIGYVAYYQFYAPRVGRPGKNALRLLCGGGILLAMGHVSFMMGFIGFFLFSGAEINATFLFFRTLFAFGLIGLGLALWLEEPIS